MVNGIRTIYPCGLNKGFNLKFCLESRVQHEAAQEGRSTHRLKHCEYNNEDEDNCWNTLNDKNPTVVYIFLEKKQKKKNPKQKSDIFFNVQNWV